MRDRLANSESSMIHSGQAKTALRQYIRRSAKRTSAPAYGRFMSGEVEAPRQTTQNHYFVATEHDPEAADGGEGAAQGFTWATPWPVSFGPSERNKIKILLRLKYICVIIELH